MKQSEKPSGDLKPEHKKTIHRMTIGPTTVINSQAPTIWNGFRRRCRLVRGLIHSRVKKGSKIIKNNLVNNHVCSWPLKISVVPVFYVPAIFNVGGGGEGGGGGGGIWYHRCPYVRPSRPSVPSTPYVTLFVSCDIFWKDWCIGLKFYTKVYNHKM